MQDDIIRTRRDSQKFGIGDWCGFLFFNGFVILHAIGFTSGAVAGIWQEVLSGDYTQTDLVKAIAISVIVFPLILAFYSSFLFGHLIEFEQRFTTVEAGDLVFTRRNILGFSRTRRVPVGQIVEVRLDQGEGEDGTLRHTLSIKLKNGRPLDLTRPESNFVEMATLAERLRTALRSADRTDASVTRPYVGIPESVSSISFTPRP